jgi:hypothetical protein
METMITQLDDYKHSRLVQKINALPEEALDQVIAGFKKSLA